jgi:hypothetical protein
VTIDERLDRIEQKLETLLALMRGAGASAPARGAARADTPPAAAGLEVASDADLDGPRGDPEVRFLPKRWTGADYKGQRFSQCDADFLDMLAETFEWFARRDDETGATDKNGNPKSRWGRLDASRARGWSRRLRGGGGPSVSKSSAPMPSTNGSDRYVAASDDDIPF